ncbi:MAG: glycosyltransferase family 4 protein [Candidatus Eisenbacteria bacterium]|uniref:Glycosyltransferase family 4 protein n=1 Tax=Eiseniibacteriota bacterium TaxID=2212470 RepID=A0A948W836_UNCEI|nr:glycosyltransferase family 4 protein [Candidatus Eisenbacteria bacterium]MBU1948836.1 glycosyltransferase family 4 protein [Candidatus Eisenbacteria bacterium]MBU2692291.1 glycosyltransferase family 4 protein [Candidatus Eisenbacteria bacterium]
MKIIIANNRYFVSGGPERYLFSVKQLLADRGHEVIPFSVNYSKTEPTPYQSYFVDPPAGPEQVYYGDIKPMTPRRIMTLLSRSFYSLSSRNAMIRLIRHTNADIVYILHCSNFLSPSIIDGAHHCGVPVVTRLSDFHLFAPCYLFLRDGEPCELCAYGDFYNALRYKCLQNSISVSLARVGAMLFHRLIGLQSRVSAYAAPSEYLRAKVVQLGLPGNKVHLLPSFVQMTPNEHETSEKAPDGLGDFVYFGRLSPEKGLDILLKAYALFLRKTPEPIENQPRLVLAGWETDESERLQRTIPPEIQDNVRFAGALEGDALRRLVGRARATILPSLCYENSPMALLESMSWGTPVIASRIGSLPEVIRHEETGLLVEPGSPTDLAQALARAAGDPGLIAKMSLQAQQEAFSRFGADLHYDRLLKIFGMAVETR